MAEEVLFLASNEVLDSNLGRKILYPNCAFRGFPQSFQINTASRSTLGLNQPPIQWLPGTVSPGVERQGREADQSPPSSVEVKKRWSNTSTPPYVFMAWANLALPRPSMSFLIHYSLSFDDTQSDWLPESLRQVQIFIEQNRNGIVWDYGTRGRMHCLKVAQIHKVLLRYLCGKARENCVNRSQELWKDSGS
jgi:hypothetical protein